MRQQHTLMKFDPATGAEKPYPSHADQWRDWHGRRTAWLFNPWTGERRFAEDVGSDIGGQLIIPPGEPVYAADDAGPEQGRGDLCLFCDSAGGAKTYAHQASMPINGKVVCIDWCIHRIVAALNAGGVRTLSCCCGHGRTAGRIDLEDGRVLLIENPHKPDDA